jgi:hypothetical protein
MKYPSLLCLVGFLGGACVAARPQLSERPMPSQLTSTQAALEAVLEYLAPSSNGEAGRVRAVFIGIDPSDLPPGSAVGSDARCPRPIEAGYLIEPRDLHVSADSLGMTMRLFLCSPGPGRGGAEGHMELRRRPGRIWTVWRWEVDVIS